MVNLDSNLDLSRGSASAGRVGEEESPKSAPLGQGLISYWLTSIEKNPNRQRKKNSVGIVTILQSWVECALS
jgi:hypothetical protein